MHDLAALIGADVPGVNFYRPTKRGTNANRTTTGDVVEPGGRIGYDGRKDDAKDDHAEGPLRLGSKRPHVSRRPLAIVTPHNSVTDHEGRCPGGGFRTPGPERGLRTQEPPWLSSLRSICRLRRPSKRHRRRGGGTRQPGRKKDATRPDRHRRPASHYAQPLELSLGPY